jgi:predicted transcriptional regulator
MVTTIQIDEKVKNTLEKLKIHPRDTYNKVIERLISISDDEGELSEETIRHIEQSLEDIKKGRVYTLEEVRKKLKLK